jgi:DNA adenine methylase
MPSTRGFPSVSARRRRGITRALTDIARGAPQAEREVKTVASAPSSLCVSHPPALQLSSSETRMLRKGAAGKVAPPSGVLCAGSSAGGGRPFLKWAGGKRQLLASLLKNAPPDPARYFEPFVGGGALFFALRPPHAVLADVNARLIRTYKGVRDDVEEVIRLLRDYPHDSAFFYRLREESIDSGSDAQVAAWFIYLNKTGFNGLYRVNRRNGFNVPFGRNVNPNICDEVTLRACSAALAGTELLEADFEVAVAKAKRGDFVYFDPPYVPLSTTSSFTSYTSHGFGPAEQTRLRDTAGKLKRRGVRVLLSNSSAPFVRELYAHGFDLKTVSATRQVNSKATARGPIVELLIT